MTQSLATTHVAPRDSQLLEFKSCGRHYACDLLWVKEVLRSPIVTPVSMAASYVRGVIHLRGQILTAFDLEDRLGHPSSPTLPQNRCIVFKTANDLARLPQPPENHDMADSDPTGLLVDSIGDILPAGRRVLPAPPEALSGLDTRFIAGVISSEFGLITVLQISNLVSVAEPKRNGV